MFAVYCFLLFDTLQVIDFGKYFVRIFCFLPHFFLSFFFFSLFLPFILPLAHSHFLLISFYCLSIFPLSSPFHVLGFSFLPVFLSLSQFLLSFSFCLSLSLISLLHLLSFSGSFSFLSFLLSLSLSLLFFLSSLLIPLSFISVLSSVSLSLFLFQSFYLILLFLPFISFILCFLPFRLSLSRSSFLSFSVFPSLLPFELALLPDISFSKWSCTGYMEIKQLLYSLGNLLLRMSTSVF